MSSADLAAAARAVAADSLAKAMAASAQPIKRKRKEPSATTPNGAAPASAPAATANGAAATAVTLDTFLMPINPAIHSALQAEILSIFFPATKNAHGAHLYRQLPGPQPASIVRKDLAKLEANDYWATEKSDGERAMLFISKERQSAYLLDRKFLIKQLRHSMYVRLWATLGDTLIDGELVEHDFTFAGGPQATFLIFDLLMLNGERIMDKRLSERLAAIGQGIVMPYRAAFPHYACFPASAPSSSTPAPSAADGSDHPLAIRAKSFHRKHHLKDGIFDHIRQLHGGEYEFNDGKRRNKNDGVIFTPEHDTYMCKEVQLLKWKWPGLNSIDFLCRAPWFDSEGKLMLYSTASEMPEREGAKGQTVTIHLRSTVLSAEKRAWFLQSVSGKASAIVEMQYESATSSWVPKLFRWDKSAPNFMSTVIGTLETVIDNVMPNDLYAACNKKGQPPPPHAHTRTALPPPPSQSQGWSSAGSASAVTPAAAPPSSASIAPPPSSFYTTSSAAPQKIHAVFEQIAAAPDETIVVPTRLFGD